MAKQFCIQELRKLLGFNEVEEIANHLLENTSPNVLSAEVKSLLGPGPSTNKFLSELQKKLKPDNSQPKAKAKQTQQPTKPVCFVSQLNQIGSIFSFISSTETKIKT